MHNARAPRAGRGAESPRKYLRGGRFGSARLEATHGEFLSLCLGCGGSITAAPDNGELVSRAGTPPRSVFLSPFLGGGGSITAAPDGGELVTWPVHKNRVLKNGAGYVAILGLKFLVRLLCSFRFVCAPCRAAWHRAAGRYVFAAAEVGRKLSPAALGVEAPTPASPAPRKRGQISAVRRAGAWAAAPAIAGALGSFDTQQVKAATASRWTRGGGHGRASSAGLVARCR